MWYNLNMQTNLNLLKAFKPPRCLSLPAAAFDVSDHSIKYMEVKPLKDVGLVPSVYEERKIKEGIIKEGDIQDLDALVEELRRFRKKYKSFSFVNIALPEELAFVFDIRLKKSDLEEGNIRQYIEFKLPEFIPFNPQNAIFDYDILSDSPTVLHIAVTVYTREIVEEYASAFEEVGYTVKSAELETVSIARAIVPNNLSSNNQTVMVLDIGTNKVGVSILRGLAPVFSTTITHPILKEFEDMFRKVHNRKPKDMQELYDWKFKNGVLLADVSNSQSFKTAIIDEIRKIKDYYTNHKNSGLDAIQEIYIAGGNAATKGIDAIFSRELELPARLGNVWQNLLDLEKYIPEIDRQRSYKLATLTGLVLKEQVYE